MQQDSYNEKSVIEEKKPEWKATATNTAVSSFFAQYTARMRKRQEIEDRISLKKKSKVLAKKIASG